MVDTRKTVPQGSLGADTGRVPGEAASYVFAITRIALGWVFLWAFVDKLFGLGFATPAKGAMLSGGSPTEGFLSHAAAGPLQGFYNSFAGAAWADYLFMTGLFAIGVALILGIGMRIAAGAGAVLLLLMWSAVLPPENNPFMDDHIIYALVLVGLALVKAENTLGFGKIWGRTQLVQRYPAMK